MQDTDRQAYYDLLDVIAGLAKDVQDAMPVLVYIADAARGGPAREEALIRLVASIFHCEDQGYASNEREFLRNLHIFYGESHQALISDMRRWAQANDPNVDDENSSAWVHGFGWARDHHHPAHLAVQIEARRVAS